MDKEKLILLLIGAALFVGCAMLIRPDSGLHHGVAASGSLLGKLTTQGLRSVSCTCGQMVRTECYSLTLAQTEAGPQLSGYCFDAEGSKQQWDARPMPPECFEALVTLLNEHHAIAALQQGENSAPIEAQDAATWHIELRWEDGTTLTTDHPGALGPVLGGWLYGQAQSLAQPA